MIRFFIFIFFLASTGITAQEWDFEKPDYMKIEKTIRQKKSNFYYPELMKRYMAGDSTMTMEEKRHLYYGFAFHRDYAPYHIHLLRDSLNTLIRKEDYDAHTLRKILHYGNLMLEKDPFDLSTLDMQLMALEKSGDEEGSLVVFGKMMIVVDAILSSGDGLQDDTPIYVIDTSHEYDMLEVLGFRFGGSQSLRGENDYLTLAENEYEIDGLYFDVRPCLQHLKKSFR